MRLPISLTLLLIVATHATRTFAEDFPDRLIALIKANDHIGVTMNRQTGEWDVNILTRDEYELAKDLGSMELSQVTEKHPDFAKQIARVRDDDEKARAQGRSQGVKPGETQISAHADTGDLCRVLHVGEDYILIEFPSPKPRRVAIASAKIARVTWGLSTRIHVAHPGER